MVKRCSGPPGIVAEQGAEICSGRMDHPGSAGISTSAPPHCGAAFPIYKRRRKIHSSLRHPAYPKQGFRLLFAGKGLTYYSSFIFFGHYKINCKQFQVQPAIKFPAWRRCATSSKPNAGCRLGFAGSIDTGNQGMQSRAAGPPSIRGEQPFSDSPAPSFQKPLRRPNFPRELVSGPGPERTK